MRSSPDSRAEKTANPRPTPDDAAYAARRTDQLWTLAIVAATLLVIFSFRPFSNIGRNDDFSYARTAEVFSRTGRIAYNGWGSPIMIPQAVIGGVLIRLFGFNYSVLDLFGTFCVAAVAGVMFALGRQCRLSRPAALLPTVAVVGNPITLGGAPTFLTDLPSLLLLLIALLALLRSFTPAPPSVASESVFLGFDRRRFAVFVVLAILAGSNRQINWVACLAAIVPVFFAVRSRADRGWIAGGFAALFLAAAALTVWWGAQPFISPTNMRANLLILVGYPEVALPVIYKFYAIFGLFTLPFALRALKQSDLSRPAFYLLVAAGMAPLAIHTTRVLSCFNPYLGVLQIGQYFTSCGTRALYLKGSVEQETTVFPPLLVDTLMVAGAFSLGVSLYLLLRRLRDRKSLIEAFASDAPRRYQQTASAALCLASLSQTIILVPWLGVLNAFDRYFVGFLPGFALFFLVQATLRRSGPTLSASERAVAAVSVGGVAAMAITGYAFAASYLHCSSAQAALYHRLLGAGVPAEQIDNGLEIDGDSQIRLRGHVNNKLMVPESAYSPDARGKNLTSPVADQFPAIDAHYIFSLDPAPVVGFPIDPVPVDQQTFSRLIPPYKLTVYVFRVQRAAAN